MEEPEVNISSPRTDGTVEKLMSKVYRCCRSTKGDIVTVHTPGAGGYGDPKNRKPEAVLSDVIEHKVSIDKAERIIRSKNREGMAADFRLA